METRIESTTEKNREGINISYSEEQSFGERLLKILPSDWKIKIHWCQILFSDVQYEIKKEEKIIEINYNKGLN